MQSKSGNLSSDLAKICLEGEGRGRIQHFSGRHLFNFESAIEKEVEQWLMAVEIPTQGEELFKLDWSKGHHNKVSLYGPFAKRLIYEVRKSDRRHLPLLRHFLKSFALVMKMRASQNWEDLNCETTGQQVVCRDFSAQEAFSWESWSDRLELVFPLPGKLVVKMNFFELADGKFQRSTLALLDPKQYGPSYKAPLQMDLFFDQCAK